MTFFVLLKDFNGFKVGSVVAASNKEEKSFIENKENARPANTHEIFFKIQNTDPKNWPLNLFSYWEHICSECGAAYITHKQVKPSMCECKTKSFSTSLKKMPCPPLENRKEIAEILKNPAQHFLLESQKLFQGETQASLSIFLVCSLGLVKNHNSTSSNLLINSSSGAGKDFIATKILTAFDPNFAIYRSRISPTALNYWHDSRKEPEWTWNEKILYLSDISNSVLNSDTFKCYSSGQNVATITEKGKTIELEVKGKPVLLLSAAFPSQNQENLRRFPIVSLNETNEQTENVLSFQAKQAAAEPVDFNYSFTFREALHYLEPVNVILPFAQKLAKVFPKHLNARTAFPRLLDYIKASAAIHQYFRKKTTVNAKEFVVANIEKDYALAREVFLFTTSNAFLIPLTKRQKTILSFFGKNLEEQFSFSQLHSKSQLRSIPERSFRRELERIKGYDLLSSQEIEKENSIKPVIHYSYKKYSPLILPTASELTELVRKESEITVAQQADLAEQEKNTNLTQSAKSAKPANENQEVSSNA